MYAIIDTEGSDLFNFKLPADDPSQPRLAELAIVYADEEFNITGEYQTYIRPDGWEVSPSASRVNKLTTELLLEKGVPVVEALAIYANAVVEEGRVIIAHNAQHDCKQLRAELRRAGLDDLFERTKNICTMRSAMPLKVKKLNGKGGFPGLADVAAHFGFEQGEAHTGLDDARTCARIARKLHLMGHLLPAQVHYAKNPPQKEEA